MIAALPPTIFRSGAFMPDLTSDQPEGSAARGRRLYLLRPYGPINPAAGTRPIHSPRSA
jgi:hypothetical protein